MTRSKVSEKRMAIRTRITDLPKIAVELDEKEMRIFSGGLTPNVRACATVVVPNGGSILGPTNRATDGDWDTDWPPVV